MTTPEVMLEVHLCRGVVLWRKWLDESGPPAWAPGTDEPSVREPIARLVLLDRWEQHTKSCPHCLRVHATRPPQCPNAACVPAARACFACGLAGKRRILGSTVGSVLFLFSTLKKDWCLS